MSTARCESAGSSCCAKRSSWLSFTANSSASERVEQRAAKLREHAEPLAPAGPLGLIARGFKQLAVAAKQSQHIVAQRRQIFRRRAAKALENRLEEAAEQKKFLSQAVAQPQACAVGKHQRGDGERNHDAQQHFAHAIERQLPARADLGTSMMMVMVTPASRELLRRLSRPQTMIARSTARM